ncbi:hypothetical protein GF374_03050 [Candidatus Woesearchaeota archaeon]|nr:hypothetical protein [Candidatus Woesearchaeota archaeon]
MRTKRPTVFKVVNGHHLIHLIFGNARYLDEEINDTWSPTKAIFNSGEKVEFTYSTKRCWNNFNFPRPFEPIKVYKEDAKELSKKYDLYYSDWYLGNHSLYDVCFCPKKKVLHFFNWPDQKIAFLGHRDVRLNFWYSHNYNEIDRLAHLAKDIFDLYTKT